MDGWRDYEVKSGLAVLAKDQCIRATLISGITAGGVVMADGEPFKPSAPNLTRQPEIGGYAMVFSDGYRAVAPKWLFEARYIEVERPDLDSKTPRNSAAESPTQSLGDKSDTKDAAARPAP